MWRVLEGDLPEPDWPGGVTVRTYEAADAGAVKALLDEAYRTWDDEYVARTQDEWERWMTQHDEFDPELWFLVERGGDLVACALHWKETERRGWVKDLAVRESDRGQGLGKALLQHGFRAYARRGVRRVGLKVESRNPTGALQLYERVGFVVDRTFREGE
jgi:ribosomal protein S18 acetylase RimI-like enzyme